MARRRKFSDEYKREAVRLATQPGVAKSQVGRELGINANLLSRWCRDFAANGAAAFPGPGKPRDEEMAALNRELARKSHVHFNLIGGPDHRFMAPAIFTEKIVKQFHASWGRFGRDGDRTMPPCMGYQLAPRENAFGTGAKKAL